MRLRPFAPLIAGLVLSLIAPPMLRADDKPIRALFICGGCCHDYLKQRKIIPEGISARANVEWTIAYDNDRGTKKLNAVYANPDWAKGFDIIVHDECSADVKDMAEVENILKPHKEGLPGVVLHCAMHCYRTDGWNQKKVTPWFEFTGDPSTHHRAQAPIEITFTDPNNEITKGLENWTTIHEELYNNELGDVLPTAHALAKGHQTYDDKDKKTGAVTKHNDFTDTVVWTNEYNGKARVFGTTIGHNNETCADPRYLELLTRGLLWAVGKLDADHLKPARQVYMEGADPKDAKSDASGSTLLKPDANGMTPLDLARGKTATASSSQGESHLPGAALDGDSDTRWCAADGSFPQWWQVDLGASHDLIGCRILWEKENVVYHYKVEGSSDGQAWRMLSDQSETTDKQQAQENPFVACCGKEPIDAKQVRFVRITVLGTDSGAWASFFDVAIYGTEKVKASLAAKPVTSTPAGGVSQIKPPPGFDLTVFAAPPDVSYCTAVSAAPSGAVFIGVDEDGSLGKKPDKGRVIRAVDSKGTGVADQFTVFAKMDHPRGLIWDDGKLFVLHPPFLSVYYDDNNTGVANRSQVLVTGISNEKLVASRGADHTTNGIRLGIDGWIYIATGDFGCLKATGVKDGTTLQFHYGGILRIRPDGTGLEVYSYGTRNIYDVAIDPLANVFTRDNTNDGDDWNDRLAYDVPTGYYGYPSRFMHFPGEFIDCMADFGGGAPCGSLFIDEPGIPGGLYTVEWGNSQIDHHPLAANGAGFKVATRTFEKFMDLPRGTDVDVDASSHLFATSWAGGGFDYSTPNVGYVVRLTPKDYAAPPFPDLRKLTDDQLLEQLTSNSHTRRLTTQREILRRGDSAAFEAGLVKLIKSDQPLPVRVAAVFTLKLLAGDKANQPLVDAAAASPELREFALRAMIDKKNDSAVAIKPFVDALSDGNPRVRLVAAWGIGRLGHAEQASALLPLTADPDFLVSHVAVKALVALKATDACLNAVEPSNTPGIVAGALNVLKEIHDVNVVKGLIERTARLTDPATRSLAYGALCRLNFTEAEWDGSWWGTRPDRQGPYYKNAEWAGTAAVNAALHAALTSEKPEVVSSLIVDLEKHQISFAELPAMISSLAAKDPKFQELQIEMLSTVKTLSADQIETLKSLASNAQASGALRAKAIRVLTREPSHAEPMTTAVSLVASLLSEQTLPPELASLRDEFLHDAQFARQTGLFATIAETGSPAEREVAGAVLMNLAGSRLVKAEYKAKASAAIEQAWAKPENALPLLKAAVRMHATAYADKAAALEHDGNPQVASAAADAASKLSVTASAGAGPLIESMKYEDVVATVLKTKGDAALGRELFQRQGCIVCHTVSQQEPQKGPMLGGIAGRYNRSELCESIMKPSAKIAQGFETQWFKTSDGNVIDAFVSRESGDEVEIHLATGQAMVLKKADIVRRGKRDFSIMPEGLVARLTPRDLASLIAYLESTTGK